MTKVSLLKDLPEDVINIALDDSDYLSTNKSGYMIAYKKVLYAEKEYFLKKFSREKLTSVYQGDYIEKVTKYYRKLKEHLELINIYAILITDDKYIIEIDEYIQQDLLMENGIEFTLETICEFSNTIVKYIDEICNAYEYRDNTRIGIDSAMWNFTKEAKFIDLNPPRIYSDEISEVELFVRPNDIDHYRRTLYRNFTREGMKLNFLATIILSQESGRIKVFPEKIWIAEVLKIVLDSITLYDEYRAIELKEIFTGKNLFVSNFTKHPIDIICEKTKF